MDFCKLLGKAFGISQDTKFFVVIFKNNELTNEGVEMTYFELGSKLISEVNNIQRIIIHLK